MKTLDLSNLISNIPIVTKFLHADSQYTRIHSTQRHVCALSLHQTANPQLQNFINYHHWSQS